MSRIAKAPVQLPAQVEVTIERDLVTVKGQKGTLTAHRNHKVDVSFASDNDRVLHFKPATSDQDAWAQAGTLRALVSNMVHGVTHAYERSLELVGVGYRAQLKGSSISLSLGFSHPIEYALPKGIVAETPTVTSIVLKGIDKQLVGQVAAEIRSYRPPEPYKGKGIKYAGEQIVRKEAKKK